jgi:hypothetical protein
MGDIEVITTLLCRVFRVRVCFDPLAKARLLAVELPIVVRALVGVGAPLAVD